MIVITEYVLCASLCTCCVLSHLILTTIIKVNFMCPLDLAKGHLDSWQNIISGSVCGSVSRRLSFKSD